MLAPPKPLIIGGLLSWSYVVRSMLDERRAACSTSGAVSRLRPEIRFDIRNTAVQHDQRAAAAADLAVHVETVHLGIAHVSSFGVVVVSDQSSARRWRRSSSAPVGSSSAKEPYWTSPARSYLAITTPVLDVWLSTSFSPAGTVPSAKRRLPLPSRMEIRTAETRR